MNTKKFLTVLLFIVIVVLGAIWLFQSCEPRTKEAENTDSTETTAEKPDISTYRTPFINANIDFGCAVLADASLEENQALFEENLYEAYARYQLPVEDDLLMIEILNTYENDPEVISAIKTGTVDCKNPSN